MSLFASRLGRLQDKAEDGLTKNFFLSMPEWVHEKLVQRKSAIQFLKHHVIIAGSKDQASDVRQYLQVLGVPDKQMNFWPTETSEGCKGLYVQAWYFENAVRANIQFGQDMCIKLNRLNNPGRHEHRSSDKTIDIYWHCHVRGEKTYVSHNPTYDFLMHSNLEESFTALFSDKGSTSTSMHVEKRYGSRYRRSPAFYGAGNDDRGVIAVVNTESLMKKLDIQRPGLPLKPALVLGA